MSFQAPRNHVQVCWRLHPHELRIQTFKVKGIVDEDESIDADAVDTDAYDDGLNAVADVLIVKVINSKK